jgi:hypothetical protein
LRGREGADDSCDALSTPTLDPSSFLPPLSPLKPSEALSLILTASFQHPSPSLSLSFPFSFVLYFPPVSSSFPFLYTSPRWATCKIKKHTIQRADSREQKDGSRTQESKEQAKRRAKAKRSKGRSIAQVRVCSKHLIPGLAFASNFCVLKDVSNGRIES